ncbi:MAG TPA: hypothetical protein VGM18_04995 [Candidatus Sulfotelmatobacter sp.]|jgi:hypothetical protein
MKVAFLDHTQLPGATKPSGGYLDRIDADRLVSELIAERISAKVIRAFAPGSSFRRLPGSIPSPGRLALAPKEVGNVRFANVPTRAGRYIAEMHKLALKAFKSNFLRTA